jgi:hypothetical protein
VQKYGTAKKGTKQYTIILFVDNQVIIEQDKDDAEYMTTKLKEYKRWGLNVHIFETE